MKHLRPAVENFLEVQPKFRERKNKDRGMAYLLQKRYTSLVGISKEVLTAAVQDYNSMDRLWRKILEERPELRGSDYDEKDHLEEKTLEELGYRKPAHVGEGPAVSK